VLKLICLDWYLPIYLQILRPKFERLVFVDLFSGAGISSIKAGSRTFALPGTTRLAANGFRPVPGGPLLRFDTILAIDRRAENLSILESTVGAMGYTPGVNLLTKVGDPDDVVEWIRGELLTPRTHAFIVSDPEHLSPKWRTLETLVRSHSGADLAILHLVSGAARESGRASVSDADHSTLDSFYGGRTTEGMALEDLSATYISMLEGIRQGQRTIVHRVKIHAGKRSGPYRYDLLFAVRETRTGSPWTRSFPLLVERIERFDGEKVEHVLRTMGGGQRTLDESQPSDRPTDGQITGG
jgi:hypothetical protein